MLKLGTVTVPANRSRNNTNTGASVLDLATLAGGNLNTKVRAHAGGTAGDAITVRAVGDSAAAAGVTISQTSTAVTIHYESGISTVANVEAAIEGVTVASQLINVDVAGTGATVLTAPGDNFVATHLAGGAAGAFAIPLYQQGLRLKTAGADLYYEITPDTNSPSNFSTTAARGNLLLAGIEIEEKINKWGVAAYIAAQSVAGGTISVWGTP